MAFESEPIVIEYDVQRFKHDPVKADMLIRRRLNELGQYLVQWMAERAPKDTTIASESLRYDVSSFGQGAYELIISSTLPTAGVRLETGRGPGGFPPLDAILGWVTRRSFTGEARKSVDTVGKRIGTSYRQRKFPKSIVRRVADVTASFAGDDDRIREAYKVMFGIARRGTRSKPKLFTKVILNTEVEQQKTWDRIEEDFAREL